MSDVREASILDRTVTFALEDVCRACGARRAVVLEATGEARLERQRDVQHVQPAVAEVIEHRVGKAGGLVDPQVEGVRDTRVAHRRTQLHRRIAHLA